MASIAEYLQQLGIKIGNNVLAGLDRVNPADLHKPDLLHNIYLRLFKNMMEWVEQFLKKHKRQPALDDARKVISPNSQLSVPNKTYREVTQWQGKEMCNLGCCMSAVLASALRNPDTSQYHDLKYSLKCVSVLVDLSLIGQYHCHTRDTLVYMERYLQTFYQTKDIFLEFSSLKATRAEGKSKDRNLRELMANQCANKTRQNTAAKRRRQVDQHSLERANPWADCIRHENHFDFIKMHSLSHLASYLRPFGSISMYSTKIGELALAHNEQSKEGYHRSNKNEAARQILSQYGCQHPLGMHLKSLEALLKTGLIVV